MVSLRTIKKRLKSSSRTGCYTITPVSSDINGIRGTKNPACDVFESESFDSVEKIEPTTNRQLSLPQVKSTSNNELDIQGNFHHLRYELRFCVLLRFFWVKHVNIPKSRNSTTEIIVPNKSFCCRSREF